MVKSAFETGIFDHHLAETLVVLIPKVEPLLRFKEVRPISLCNVVAKIITKVLVNRMRLFLDEIISTFQNGFIPSRGTSKNVIIAQEVFTL